MSRQQEFNRSIYGDIVAGDMYKTSTVQIAQQTIHNHYACPPPSAPPAQLARHAPLAPPARLPATEANTASLTLGQKRLLQLMKPMARPTRIEVLDFMRAQFGTGMVRELSPHAVSMTHLHVQSIFVVKN